MTTAPAYEDPIPSPDGRTLFVPGRRPHLVGVDGTGARRLGLSRFATVAAWSPDGKALGYTPSGGTGVWTYDLARGRRTRISFGEGDDAPAWSPDGSRIAYASFDGVVVADSRGRDARVLVSTAIAAAPVWSPDGKTIAVVDVSKPASRLLLVPANGRGPRRVIPGGDEPAWSPDGARLAFTAVRDAHSDLFVARGDGSRPRRLTFGTGGAESVDPRWSPDGARIVFHRFGSRHPGELELSELWSVEPDGSGLRELTRAYPGGGNNYPIGWIRGNLRHEPSPKPWAQPRTLLVPYPVGELSADGARVAVAPLVPYSGDTPLLPSGPILVWRPGTREVVAHLAAGCIFPAFVSLAGSRLAFDCDRSGDDVVSQSVRLYRSGDPVPVEVFRGESGAHGEVDSGTMLATLAGSGSLVAFASVTAEWTGKDVVLTQKRLWRVDGVRRRLLLTGRALGDPVDVDGGRIALQGGPAGAAVVDRDGRRVDRLQAPELRSKPRAFERVQRRLVLTGSRAAVLAGRRLRVYEVSSGRLLATWPLADPPQKLAGAAAGLVVYVHGRLVHVIRLRDGRAAAFRVPAERIPEANPGTRRVEADLSDRGLYYSYGVRRGRYPGRVVFVPLPRALARLRAA
jgi:hypothetical protein